jgi:hypothetical protein
LQEEEKTLHQRLTDAAEDYTAGVLTRAQIRTITAGTRTRLEEIEAQLAQIGSEYDLASMLGDVNYVYEQIEGMTQDERRALVRAVVERVALFPRPKGVKRMIPESVRVTLRAAAEGRAGR